MSHNKLVQLPGFELELVEMHIPLNIFTLWSLQRHTIIKYNRKFWNKQWDVFVSQGEQCGVGITGMEMADVLTAYVDHRLKVLRPFIVQ